MAVASAQPCRLLIPGYEPRGAHTPGPTIAHSSRHVRAEPAGRQERASPSARRRQGRRRCAATSQAFFIVRRTSRADAPYRAVVSTPTTPADFDFESVFNDAITGLAPMAPWFAIAAVVVTFLRFPMLAVAPASSHDETPGGCSSTTHAASSWIAPKVDAKGRSCSSGGGVAGPPRRPTTCTRGPAVAQPCPATVRLCATSATDRSPIRGPRGGTSTAWNDDAVPTFLRVPTSPHPRECC